MDFDLTVIYGIHFAHFDITIIFIDTSCDMNAKTIIILFCIQTNFMLAEQRKLLYLCRDYFGICFDTDFFDAQPTIIIFNVSNLTKNTTEEYITLFLYSAISLKNSMHFR